MYIKIHESQARNIIAICDNNLIDKKFSDKSGLYLDVSEEEAFKVVKEGKNNSSIFNIVGKKISRPCIEKWDYRERKYN